jgi:DNA polymerase elongation subunit (family B)
VKIFIDIETIPTGERPQLSELKPPAQMTKAETIQKWMEDTEAREADLDKIYRKRALDYMQGQVLCIAYAIEDGPVAGIINDSEEALFKQLEADLMENKTIESMFRQGSPVVWISYNGRAFDYPYLSLRAAKYGCKFLSMALRPFNEREHLLDVMKMITHTDAKGMTSLDSACQFFYVPTPKDQMDGSMVYDEYLAGNGNKILEYCMADVVATRKIYNILTGKWD